MFLDPRKNNYVIHYHDKGYGAYTTGPVPCADVMGLVTMWQPRGYTHFDARIAQKIGASLVCGSKEGLNAWRKELKIEGEIPDAGSK